MASRARPVRVHDPKFSGILSDDERSRADKFYFNRDRRRFIVARAGLRIILGRYLGIEPEQLRFHYNRYGKPSLSGHSGEDELRFNVSHSRDLALHAITREGNVGIDVEHLRENLANIKLPNTSFHLGKSQLFAPSRLRSARVPFSTAGHERKLISKLVVRDSQFLWINLRSLLLLAKKPQ
jgi:hypothetical protein